MFLKRLFPRTIFSLTPSSLPSPYSISIARCSSSSPSHLTHSHPDPRNVGVSVWWDLDNCTVPPGVNVLRAAQAITAAIKSSGIEGRIQIRAFGDMLRFARTKEALPSTGIHFTPVPHACLHQLRLDNYNLLLASKESAPAFVCSAATILWDWDALVRGENLTGRYFNQPPMDSWYGRYEGPLEDPFTEIERAAFAPDDQLGELQTLEVK